MGAVKRILVMLATVCHGIEDCVYEAVKTQLNHLKEAIEEQIHF